LLIEKLKDEEENVRHKILRLNAGEVFRKKVKCMEMENNLISFKNLKIMV
jgi:hypothetical protein